MVILRSLAAGQPSVHAQLHRRGGADVRAGDLFVPIIGSLRRSLPSLCLSPSTFAIAIPIPKLSMARAARAFSTAGPAHY